jgi:hypothetical protein
LLLLSIKTRRGVELSPLVKDQGEMLKPAKEASN